ncbi:hypothetical protein EV182_002991, partial [Spiromyces aspiralis]
MTTNTTNGQASPTNNGGSSAGDAGPLTGASVADNKESFEDLLKGVRYVRVEGRTAAETSPSQSSMTLPSAATGSPVASNVAIKASSSSSSSSENSNNNGRPANNQQQLGQSFPPLDSPPRRSFVSSPTSATPGSPSPQSHKNSHNHYHQGGRLQRRHTVMQPSMSIVSDHNGRARVVLNDYPPIPSSSSGTGSTVLPPPPPVPSKYSNAVGGGSPSMPTAAAAVNSRPRRSKTISCHSSANDRRFRSRTHSITSATPPLMATTTSDCIKVAGSRPGNVLACHNIAAAAAVVAASSSACSSPQFYHHQQQQSTNGGGYFSRHYHWQSTVTGGGGGGSGNGSGVAAKKVGLAADPDQAIRIPPIMFNSKLSASLRDPTAAITQTNDGCKEGGQEEDKPDALAKLQEMISSLQKIKLGGGVDG